jgi:hypothetical protein
MSSGEAMPGRKAGYADWWMGVGIIIGGGDTIPDITWGLNTKFNVNEHMKVLKNMLKGIVSRDSLPT